MPKTKQNNVEKLIRDALGPEAWMEHLEKDLMKF